MDEESNKLPREILDLQREQTELLRKHLPPLWTRVRFSLLALLIVMTIVAVGLGIAVFAVRSLTEPQPAPVVPPADDLFLFGGIQSSPVNTRRYTACQCAGLQRHMPVVSATHAPGTQTAFGVVV
jgi:hypothetical protein